MDYEQKLIADVLRNAQIAEMPQKTNPDSFLWIEAVAKIKKADGNIGYGIVKRNSDLSYRVTYINGSTATVADLLEVYPYVNLDKTRIKKFKDKDDVQGRIKYLKSLNLPYAGDWNFDEMTIDDLNREIVKAALYLQLNAQEA